MLVIPGAEVTQNSFRAKVEQNSHVIALGIKQYISADQPAPTCCGKSGGRMR